jgi:hypothetical protein
MGSGLDRHRRCQREAGAIKMFAGKNATINGTVSSPASPPSAAAAITIDALLLICRPPHRRRPQPR